LASSREVIFIAFHKWKIAIIVTLSTTMALLDEMMYILLKLSSGRGSSIQIFVKQSISILNIFLLVGEGLMSTKKRGEGIFV